MILIDILNKYTSFPYDICYLITHYLNMELYYLPESVLSLILEYVPYHIKYILNNKLYKQYHYLVKFKPFDSYVRNIIRNDIDFVFLYVLNEHKHKWNKKKKIKYKNLIVNSYFELVNKYCIEYKSNKCRKILNNELV